MRDLANSVAVLLTSLTVAGLYVYPVKSAGGIALTTAEVGRGGLRHDRRWMIVDERGMFVAQRAVGGLGVGIRSLCLLRSGINGSTLTLAAPHMPNLALPFTGIDGLAREVRIWRRSRRAVDEGDAAADWCTTFLSRERPGRYRLVRLPADEHRATAFADTAPVLVIAQASLDALNDRLPDPVPMDRFRPNIVLAGGSAHVEDSADRLTIGTVKFRGAGLCVRCVMPTIDQDTAEQSREPLRTLAAYRTVGGGVVFGRHFVPATAGAISVGDPVAAQRAAPGRTD